MAPINLLCKDFLKSLLLVDERRRQRDPAEVGGDSHPVQSTSKPSGDKDQDQEDDESGSDSEASGKQRVKLAARKAALEAIERAKMRPATRTEQLGQDDKLRKLLEEGVEIEFWAGGAGVAWSGAKVSTFITFNKFWLYISKWEGTFLGIGLKEGPCFNL